ncbi:MAG: accessory factor UbiK family protein [Pseudomonadota bacterium]
MEKNLLEDLASKIGNLLPPAPTELKKEVEESIRQAIRSSITRLDLVTRDEFEIQSAVLQRTRMKLEALEKKVAELEKILEK